MSHRTTFALDDATIRRLKTLAKTWRVSQAEVVRRAIERAEREQNDTAPDPLEQLKEFHNKGGLAYSKGVAYLAEVAENRTEWGRNG
jgi:predicted transcriptional regulator